MATTTAEANQVNVSIGGDVDRPCLVIEDGSNGIALAIEGAAAELALLGQRIVATAQLIEIDQRIAANAVIEQEETN